MTKHWIGSLAALLLTFGAAEAAPIVYFGQDLGAPGGVPLVSRPNADAARGNFNTHIVSPITQNLEGLADGGAPINLGFGSITLGGAIATVATHDGDGGFPISGTKLLRLDGTGFTLTLNSAVTALGFYGIDVGDVGGQLNLTEFGNVLHAGATNGSVFFYGVTDTTPFSVLHFNNSFATDRFNFDDFTVGKVDIGQADPELAATPEPGTLLLLGTSLAGMAGAAWKRRKAARLAD